ncbi:fatty acid desaturase [Cercophora scortea]|uniref:Delta 8-(E)-sphingolipid desaturase n=1 Tax=Cercophora scortea TaxID=314031 RepID=A0AAE0IAV2_9PEZI|nr:fatty acid desaturase [Cercophora scortea]
MDRDRKMSAREIEGLIADGHTIVIFEESVLRLDSWVPKHPGGRLAILHMVGKDATDEINAYHSAATLKTMKAFRIGRKPAGVWTNSTPPIRGGIYEKYEALPGAQSDELSVSDTEESTIADSIGRVTDRSSPTTTISECSSEPECPETDNEKEVDVAAGLGLNKVASEKPEAVLTARSQALLSAARYTDWALQQEIDGDVVDYPSLDVDVQQDIVRKYRILHQKVKDGGHYDCRYLEYGKEMVRYSTLFMLFVVFCRYEWYMTSAVFLGMFWHQIMFSAHDAGHLAITNNFVIDTLIGTIVADLLCGLSIGWWKSSHNVHHLITNSPEHDPDTQNVPIFATSPAFFKSLHSSYYDFTYIWDAAADFIVPFQRYSYYPIMGVARFNLYFLSWLHVFSAKAGSLGESKAWWIRPLEAAFMSIFWYVFGYLFVWCTLPTWPIRIGFVLISHIVTMPLHVQITLSHWGMSHADHGDGESFPQRQLRTTMDVDCPAWFDWFHGGLQFQAVHHLFPRVPRHNLRRVQFLVREFCEETGIPYSILGFVDGNMKVLDRLQAVGDQVKNLINCQKYMAETGESGLH